jgi:hypothetical protein
VKEAAGAGKGFQKTRKSNVKRRGLLLQQQQRDVGQKDGEIYRERNRTKRTTKTNRQQVSLSGIDRLKRGLKLKFYYVASQPQSLSLDGP